MHDTILLIIGLGIAGIDPFGAGALFSGICAGVSRLKLAIFTGTVFVFTVLLGVTASLIGTQIAGFLAQFIPSGNSAVWAYVNIVVATVISFWLIAKLFGIAGKTPKKREKKADDSLALFVFFGAVVALSSVIDPTFLGTVAVTSQINDILLIALSHALWVLVSQIMLFVLFVAFMFSRHKVLIEFTRRFWRKYESGFNQMLYLFTAIVIVFLLADSIYFFTSGAYLISW